MEGDQNSSADDVESDDSANLADLRKKIELSNIQLLELTYNDGIDHLIYRKIFIYYRKS